MGTVHETLFTSTLQHLHRGDFSLLEPLFVDDESGKSQVVRWHEEGRFRDDPQAVAEALTCASFLGRTQVVEYLLAQGVDPAGGNGTGLNALHWAANRGQLEAVRLLLRAGAPLETLNMYGGTVLGATVWAAVNEPRRDHAQIVEALLDAGAHVDAADYPSGQPAIDEILARYRSV